MEDAKGEKKSDTMEERVEDTSSWGEWTIINDDKDKSPDESPEKSDKNDDKDDEECATAEEAREVVEEIDPSTLETATISSSPRDEDSDGISVIAECDKGDTDGRTGFSRITEPVDKLIRVGVYANIIAACCLAAAIGFGIGCVVGNGNSQLPTSDVQVTTEKSLTPTKPPNVDVFEDESVTIESEPFTSTSNVANIPQRTVSRMESSDLPRNVNQLREQNFDPLNIRNFEKIRTFRDSLQKVKLSLDTLCSLIDKNEKFDRNNNICYKKSAILDIVELKDTVEYIVSELGYKEDISTKKFIQNVESKIEHLSLTFLSDLTKIVENSITKIDQKLAKMRGKLHHRICLIRNTYANEAKVQEILDKRHISVENCGKAKTSYPEAANSGEKRKYKKLEKREIDTVYSDEIIEVESSEVDEETEWSANNKQKRRNSKSEEFKLKKKYKPYKDTSNENSNEELDFYSSENFKNQEKNNFKSKEKYKSHKQESNENSYEDMSIDSFEVEKENRNSYKSKSKYGSIKGETRDNFVEKHQANYDNFNDDKQQSENVCYSKKCSKPYNNDEKKNRKGNGKNGEWQFERAQGRSKYRSSEDDLFDSRVWYDSRARARERARLRY